MTPLEAARRLTGHGHEPVNDYGDYVFCGGRGNDGRHAPDCPWLDMPRIVAVLEAAQALWDDGLYETKDGEDWSLCRICGAVDYHEDDCRGAALVAAICGED